MSLISPVPQSTTIKLYKGIPWDATLENIRLFDTDTQRATYLSARTMGTWENCSVVSIGKRIRIQGLYNNLVDANYLSFTNGGFGDTARTYYAFVTSVDYVNAQTVELEYEVDWIQTYLFEFNYETCLVEREHVNDDTFGLNVVPEDLDTGEFIVDTVNTQDFDPAVILMYVDKKEWQSNIRDNMYMPGSVVFGTMGDVTVINTTLDELNDTPERVSALFMGVTAMIGSGTTFFSQSFTVHEFNNFIEGTTVYAPQNNKVRIYPYKFCTLDNLQGDVEQFHWEDSNTPGSMTFAVEGAALPKPSMICFPIDYKNLSATDTHNNNYSQQMVVYNNFPACPYVSDTFKAWVSEFGTSKAITQAASVITGGMGIVGGIATGNVAGAASSATNLVNNMVGYAQEKKSHQIHSLQQHGSVSESGLQYARDMIGFRVTHYSIKVKAAMRIDAFFTRYGYRVDEVKVPNIRGRANVNYVKCAVGHVGGNIATDAKLAMERALSQGTSFWHIDDIDSVLASNPIVTA